MPVYCAIRRFAAIVFLLASIASPSMVVAQHETLTEVGQAEPHKWIDLTHSFDESTIYWPTANGFQLKVDQFGMNPKGYFYAAKSYMSAEHGGTHIDAPIHFFKTGKTVDQIGLNQLIGEAAVIDVSDKCAQNPDYQIGLQDLRDWEVKHARQLVDVIVLIQTGFAKRWPNREAYLGTEKFGAEAVADLHFPGLDPIAAKWLVDHRAIKAIGIDTASIDFGQSERFQSHVLLFSHGIPAFENVGDLSPLPSEGATVIALPMKIGSGTGAPLRIIATFDPQ